MPERWRDWPAPREQPGVRGAAQGITVPSRFPSRGDGHEMMAGFAIMPVPTGQPGGTGGRPPGLQLRVF
jgi:hypothetical protein